VNRRQSRLLREYSFLVGISLDGPEAVHDRYRYNKAGHGTWKAVADAMRLLKSERVEFNVLCVVSQANVHRATDIYHYFRSIGADNLQFIPLAGFLRCGIPEPFSVSGEEYGLFLCELFDIWWPERRTVRIRYFDNIAEALAGLTPGTCTMHATCDSYAVVEYNGDVYPCDFFVEQRWKLGNIYSDSWVEIARRARRNEFASKKGFLHTECARCEFHPIFRAAVPNCVMGRKVISRTSIGSAAATR
jgi:uncharacterized protein